MWSSREKVRKNTEEFGGKTGNLGGGRGNEPLYPSRRPRLHGALEAKTAHAQPAGAWSRSPLPSAHAQLLAPRATRMRTAPKPTAHARSARQALYACAVRGCACAVRSAHAQCAPGAVTGRGEGGEGRGRAAHAQCEPRGCSGGAAVGVRGRGG